MNLAATLRAITTASAAMPTAALGSVWSVVPHRALPDLADAELLKKELRRTADRHTADLADPEARAYILLGLLGEIGELVAEALRPDPDRAKILAEAGDALWNIDALLAQHGADLSDAVAALAEKMAARHADRLAAAGYRPAPATIEELLREPGWYDMRHSAAWTLPGGADLVVDGAVVAITDEYDRAIYQVAHPTEAAAVRAALQIVAALHPR